MPHATILSQAHYPLTGAQGRSLEYAHISAGGEIDDRRFVFYDAAVIDGPNRISQKQVRSLARLAVYREDGQKAFCVTDREGDTVELKTFDRQTDCIVNEFGDQTPAMDMGDEHAEWAARKTGIETARLAQKPTSWLLGFDRDMAMAKVAPLHIVVAESMDAVQAELNNSDVSIDRWRANMVVSVPDAQPFGELSWTSLSIGELVLRVARQTVRCPVPGFDQQTGENMKDIPKLYRGLLKGDDGKPVFGVYVYPELHDGEQVVLATGDQLQIN